MKTVVEYAKKAHEQNNSDAKIKEFYIEVKELYENKKNKEDSKNAGPSVKIEKPKNIDEPKIEEEVKQQPKSYAHIPAT